MQQACHAVKVRLKRTKLSRRGDCPVLTWEPWAICIMPGPCRYDFSYRHACVLLRSSAMGPRAPLKIYSPLTVKQKSNPIVECTVHQGVFNSKSAGTCAGSTKKKFKVSNRRTVHSLYTSAVAIPKERSSSSSLAPTRHSQGRGSLERPTYLMTGATRVTMDIR